MVKLLFFQVPMMPTAHSRVNKTLGLYRRTAPIYEMSCRLIFLTWCNAFSIDSLEIPMNPPNGSSNSRIRKIAPETAERREHQRQHRSSITRRDYAETCKNHHEP